MQSRVKSIKFFAQKRKINIIRCFCIVIFGNRRDLNFLNFKKIIYKIMTEISLDIDTNQRKGLGPVPMQHHKTSCSWYAWQSNIPNSFQNPCTKTSSKTEPSDRFNYRIDRLVNSKKILSDSIKKSCYSDSIRKVGNDERNIVPVGE